MTHILQDRLDSMVNTGSNTLNNIVNTGSNTLNDIVNMGSNTLDNILPPQKRDDIKTQLTNFAAERPYLASFILSQIALSGVPVALFLTTTLSATIFALVAGLLAGLVGATIFILTTSGIALCFLLPTLFFTTLTAVTIWFWVMGAYYIVNKFNGRQTSGNHHVLMPDRPKKAAKPDNLKSNSTQFLAIKQEPNGSIDHQDTKAYPGSMSSALEYNPSPATTRMNYTPEEMLEVKLATNHIQDTTTEGDNMNAAEYIKALNDPSIQATGNPKGLSIYDV